MSSILARAVVVLEGDASKLDDAMSEAEKNTKKVGERLGEIGDYMMTHVTLPLVAGAGVLVHAFGEQQDAIARMNGVLKSSGGAAGTTAEHITALAEALAQTTTFSSSTTQSAAAMMMTFQRVQNVAGKGNDIFDQSIKVSQDLATLMGGDLSSAALQLGKALEDPETGLMMLRRAGIVFSAEEVEQVKNLFAHNQVLQAQKIILDGLQHRVGGLAETMAKTPLGQMKQMWNTLNTTMEDAGKIIFTMIQPAIKLIIDWAKAFKNLDDSTKETIIIIGGILAAIGPLLVTIGMIMKGWSMLSVIFGASAAPVALAIAAIGALIAAGYELVHNWTAVKLQFLAAWTFMKDTTFRAADWILGAIQKLTSGMSVAFMLLDKLPGPLQGIVGFLSTPAGKLADGIDTLRASLKAMSEKDLADAGKAMAALQDELDKADAKARHAGKTIKTVVPPKPPPTWAGPVLAALDDLQTALESSSAKSKVLGTSFDKAAADGSAYGAAIDAILKTHVGLNVVLDGTGTTLTTLMHKFQQLTIVDTMTQLGLALSDADKQASVLGQAFDLAGARASAYESAVNALIGLHISLDTVLDKTGLTLGGLITKLQSAKISQATQDLANALANASEMTAGMGTAFDSVDAQLQAYDAAIQSLVAAHVSLDTVVTATGETLQDLMNKFTELQGVAELSSKLRSTFEDALGAVEDFAFGAQKSFGEFVRSALLDITKLMLKILMLAALKKAFGGKDIFGIAASKIFGFANGGFIQPGQLALVGERGPELIVGGRTGISVTPMPAASHSMAAVAGGGTMVLQFNVTSIDSKDTARFFEENSGMISAAMMKAQLRSSILQRRLGR